MPRPSLAALLLTLHGCADPTALDLTLVPDPNVQSESALVSRLLRLRLVVDAPEGLYPAGPSRREGEVEIADLDGDGARELLASVSLEALGRLPLVRLERGGLPAVSGLELRLDGIGPDDSDGKPASDVELAAGSVQGVAFSEGGIASVKIPFNLRAKFRPPRVTQVFPEDGATLDSASVGSVALIFSKPMSPSSLKPGVLQVLRVEGGSETPIALKEIVIGEIGVGGPTRAVLNFAQAPGDGLYRVRVGQGALDTSGRALDQAPIQPGNQPFTSSFTLSPSASTAACPVAGCEAAWCGNGGVLCPPGAVCDAATHSCQPQGCPSSCIPATVCDPALGACLDDCRVHGGYGGCLATLRCDAATGLCR
jgi:hypothetical protein